MWYFWVVSEKFFDVNSLVKNFEFDDLGSINGLILLQHGLTRKGCRNASRIAIVDKIITCNGGMIVVHNEQLKLFNTLKKRIKVDLCYSTIIQFRDGHVEEDTKLQLMTEKAKEMYQNGFKFTGVPGKKLFK